MVEKSAEEKDAQARNRLSLELIAKRYAHDQKFRDTYETLAARIKLIKDTWIDSVASDGSLAKRRQQREDLASQALQRVEEALNDMLLKLNALRNNSNPKPQDPDNSPPSEPD
jgi:hypothetical protein